MEKRVKEKTAVVVGSREASTVDAMTAALVEREDGYVFWGGSMAADGVGAELVCAPAEGYTAVELIVERGGRMEEVVVEKEACEGFIWRLPFGLPIDKSGNSSAVACFRVDDFDGMY